jgi:hypothetical protein
LYQHRQINNISTNITSLAAAVTTHTRRPATRDQNVVRNSLMAGSISGMASTAVLYPLDVLRTKMQSASILGATASTSASTSTASSSSSLAKSSANAAASRGPLQVLKHTLQHGGVRALYTGLTLPLAAQAIYKGTVFTINNVMQSAIIDWRTWENHKTGVLQPGQLMDLDRFWCGAVAGGVNAALFVTPVEFIRNQLIAQHTKLADGQKVAVQNTGSCDVVKHSMRQHGLAALWRGVSWSIYRDTLGCGCFFYAMAWTQHQLTPPGEQPGMTATVVSGGVAGLSFWVVSLPLDTIKTWVQSSDLNTTVSAKSTVEKIYRQGGLMGVVQQLFRGWQVAYTRGIPSAAITITIYSWAYRYLDGGGEGRGH